MSQEALNPGRFCFYVRMKWILFLSFSAYTCGNAALVAILKTSSRHATSLPPCSPAPPANITQGKMGWRRAGFLPQTWELGLKPEFGLCCCSVFWWGTALRHLSDCPVCLPKPRSRKCSYGAWNRGQFLPRGWWTCDLRKEDFGELQ